MVNYTICFIKSGSRLLLLNRQFHPNQGLWNGVGGKLEPGESPAASVVREVEEETGIRLSAPRYTGLVTWGEVFNQVAGGMHAYLAEVPDALPPGPLQTPEGILAWKELDWVMDPRNGGVVSNIRRFLPVMLTEPLPYHYHCIYRQGQLRVVVRRPLSDGAGTGVGVDGQVP